MKSLSGFTDVFMSPVTGTLASSSSLPPIPQNYIWVGNYQGEPEPEPALIDMRLDMIDLRHRLGNVSQNAAPKNSTYILQSPDIQLPNAQALNQLSNGIVKNVSGALQIATANQDYLSPALETDFLWLGGPDNLATPVSNILMVNLPNLSQNKIWIGDANNRPIEASFSPSPSDASYLLKTTNDALPNSQSLQSLLKDGLLKTVSNQLTIAIPDTDYATVDTLEKIKEECQQSASDAASSATEASGSATEASGAAGEATAAAGEASGSAGAAGISAVAAAASALAAGGSAGSASSSASDASSSASDARKSAGNAANSATDAQNYLNTLLNTGLTLQGDVNGSGLLSTPISTNFKENPVLPGKQSMTIPGGLSSDRPTTPVVGMLRYNIG